MSRQQRREETGAEVNGELVDLRQFRREVEGRSRGNRTVEVAPEMPLDQGIFRSHLVALLSGTRHSGHDFQKSLRRLDAEKLGLPFDEPEDDAKTEISRGRERVLRQLRYFQAHRQNYPSLDGSGYKFDEWMASWSTEEVNRFVREYEDGVDRLLQGEDADAICREVLGSQRPSTNAIEEKVEMYVRMWQSMAEAGCEDSFFKSSLRDIATWAQGASPEDIPQYANWTFEDFQLLDAAVRKRIEGERGEKIPNVFKRIKVPEASEKAERDERTIAAFGDRGEEVVAALDTMHAVDEFTRVRDEQRLSRALHEAKDRRSYRKALRELSLHRLIEDIEADRVDIDQPLDAALDRYIDPRAPGALADQEWLFSRIHRHYGATARRKPYGPLKAMRALVEKIVYS